ncbi:MAG: DUF2344 domain-containing protein [Phycisphaerae bacterium]|nr:DUF2344 domain-containing protein [Phycisphaerae bacterium]
MKTEASLTTLPSRWAIGLAIDGDLRFLSHHDCMRAVARIATRARLPIKYSQGFNPRPALSLVCPRPVGVATRDDLVVVSLDTGATGQELVAELNRQAPCGMRFGPAKALEGKSVPRPRSIDYRLDLQPGQDDAVARRLSSLQREKSWPVERLVTARRRPVPGGGRRRATHTRTVDIKDLVTSLKLEGEVLTMTLRTQGDLWPRPGEVLRLLGLDERADLARVVRVAVEYELPKRT